MHSPNHPHSEEETMTLKETRILEILKSACIQHQTIPDDPHAFIAEYPSGNDLNPMDLPPPFAIFSARGRKVAATTVFPLAEMDIDSTQTAFWLDQLNNFMGDNILRQGRLTLDLTTSTLQYHANWIVNATTPKSLREQLFAFARAVSDDIEAVWEFAVMATKTAAEITTAPIAARAAQFKVLYATPSKTTH